jgi:DNA-directed RNA polymerase beta' subunit
METISQPITLKHLNYQACPHCGSRCKKITQESRHTNGQWNEYQYFECGFTVHFSPNYGKEQILIECEKTDEYKEKKRLKTESMKKVMNYISKLNCDAAFKATLKDKVESAKYSI